MTIENCGVIEHEDECLCDVIIPNDTQWIGDAVKDMWMGPEIVELRGYCDIWDEDSILNYLSDLARAKDNWVRVDNGFFKPIPTKAGGTVLHSIREELKKRLRSMRNPSIMQVIADLGIEWDMLMVVLFANKRMMTENELVEFEEAVLTSRYTSPEGLAKRFNMTFKSARKLHDYWGTPFAVKAEPSTADSQPSTINSHDLIGTGEQ